MELQPVGLREAARLMTESGYKISHSTLSRDIASGAIPNHGTNKRPMVLVDEAIAARADNINQAMRREPPLSSTPAANGAGASNGHAAGGEAAPADKPRAPALNTARTASEAIKAQLLKIELEEKRRTLLDKAKVHDAFVGMGTHLRGQLEQRRHALAQSLIGMASVGEIGATLTEADDRLLLALHEFMVGALDMESGSEAAPPPEAGDGDAD